MAELRLRWCNAALSISENLKANESSAVHSHSSIPPQHELSKGGGRRFAPNKSSSHNSSSRSSAEHAWIPRTERNMSLEPICHVQVVVEPWQKEHAIYCQIIIVRVHLSCILGTSVAGMATTGDYSTAYSCPYTYQQHKDNAANEHALAQPAVKPHPVIQRRCLLQGCNATDWPDS